MYWINLLYIVINDYWVLKKKKSISKPGVKECCQYKEFTNLDELRIVCSVPVS